MIPFVKRHDVREFASRNFTDQTPIFSEDWLTFILPALTSESRVEVQAFAAFHFAIAAQLRANLIKELAPANVRNLCYLNCSVDSNFVLEILMFVESED